LGFVKLSITTVSSPASLETLSIIKTNKTPNSYTVSYKWTDHFSKETDMFIIHLIVEKQKEGFKIAEVW
jgi:hypothetical protein